MIRYGLISETDARTLEKTIDLITQRDFIGQEINICEIGLFDCGTASGLYEYTTSRQYGSASMNPKEGMKDNYYRCNYTGIDCEKDKLIHPPDWMNFIRGNSNEVYNQLPDESQHLVFVDSNHSFPNTICDFFCYESKVKVGGYFAFHDVAEHIKPFTDYQRMGSDKDPDMYISCRKALHRIGVLHDELYGWRLIYDEADIENPAGGIVVLKKIHSIK